MSGKSIRGADNPVLKDQHQAYTKTIEKAHKFCQTNAKRVSLKMQFSLPQTVQLIQWKGYITNTMERVFFISQIASKLHVWCSTLHAVPVMFEL